MDTKDCVRVKIINISNNNLPQYATPGSAGMDIAVFHSDGFVRINKNETKILPTGIYVEIPDGYEIQIRSKSGLASRGIFVLNGVGTIDSDYRGEIKVILHNIGDVPVVFENGCKIAQMVLNKVEKISWEIVKDISETNRGTGGFGSTGN